MAFFRINQSGGDITTDGNHLLFKRDLNASGRSHIRFSGEFGTASLEFGFLDRAETIFTPYTLSDFSPITPFAANGSLQADGLGRHGIYLTHPQWIRIQTDGYSIEAFADE